MQSAYKAAPDGDAGDRGRALAGLERWYFRAIPLGGHGILVWVTSRRAPGPLTVVVEARQCEDRIETSYKIHAVAGCGDHWPDVGHIADRATDG